MNLLRLFWNPKLKLIAGAYTDEAKWCPGSRQPVQRDGFNASGWASWGRCARCNRTIACSKVTGRTLWHLPKRSPRRIR